MADEKQALQIADDMVPALMTHKSVAAGDELKLIVKLRETLLLGIRLASRLR